MKHYRYEALSFDAAGTLIHLREPVGESYSAVAARHGIRARPEDLDQAFRVVWKRTPLPFDDESREIDPHEKAWWSRIVKDVFATAGATLPGDEEYDRFFEDLYLHFESPGTWLADPAAHQLLAELTGSYRCIVLSNFDARLRLVLEELELLCFFETAILSCEVKASKPSPKTFQAAVDWLGLPPSKILHIGDDPVCDWEGAEKAGMGVFRIGNGEKKLSALKQELSLAP